MASESRPGVEITQQIAESSAVVASPDLVPCVVGVCHQIVSALDSDGALESDAQYGGAQYSQSSMLVTQSDFPDPRENIDELEIDEGAIYAYLYFGGRLTRLDRGSHAEYGSAFLKLMNSSRKASIRSSLGEDTGYEFDGDTGDAFTFAIDVVNPVDTSRDITVTLLGTLTAAEVVEEINAAAGADYAEVFVDTDGDFGDAEEEYVQLSSLSFGATSSVTIRAGTAALSTLFGLDITEAAKEFRVEGAGFRGQDDEDGDLATPWLEFYRGAYMVNSGEVEAWPVAATTNTVWAGTIDQDGEFYRARAGEVTYSGSSPTVPLSAATSSVPGDQFWGDGAQVGDGEVIRVEQSRFKLGKLSTSLSTFNDSGEPTNRVYDTLEVNTPTHGTPFAPKYAYFMADGLVFGSVTPEGEAAELTGTAGGLDSRPAMAVSASAIATDLALSSLTLIFAVTEDGVAGDEVTYTFTGGPFATAAAIAAAMAGDDEFSQLTIGSAGQRLVIQTTKSGSDQALTIKSTGTANAALGFADDAATADTGKDVEFATQATVTSGYLQLPIDNPDSVDLELVVTDAKGEHTISADAVDLSAVTDMDELIAAIADAFGGDSGGDDFSLYLYANGSSIPVATVAVHEDSTGTDAFGQFILTTIEGGASVSIELTAGAATDGWAILGFYDSSMGSPAALLGTGATGLTELDGIEFTHNDGTTLTTISGTASAAMETAGADARDLAALLNADDSLNGVTAGGGEALVHWFSTDGAALEVRTIEGGADMTLTAVDGFVEMGFASDVVTDSGADSVENGEDDGADGIKSETLTFQLDDNPYEYAVTFASNSLQDAIDDINELVAGAADVATEGADNNLVMSSLLEGVASKVYVHNDDSADETFAIDGTATGAGRPNPDFYLDGDGSVNLGPNILRNRSSGLPFSIESALADIYIAYTALRLDVTASAADASMLEFERTADLEASIGPISTENPLALGVFLALANAPSVSVACLGVDENNDAAPMGTIDGWARALDFLESSEIYALAPLTDSSFVQGVSSVHVQSMSQPTERGERIALLWSALPRRAVDTTVASGESGESNGTDDSFTMDTNPASELIANGIDPSDAIDFDEHLYVEMLVVDGGTSDLRRYSVEEVNGVIVNFRTTFQDDENEDGFFTTTTFDEDLEGADWSLKIRGAELVITGTTRRDLSSCADAAAEQAQAYAHRRVVYMACDSVDTSIDGITQNIAGYYVAAAVAGQIAEQSPQQPLTNLPIAGFSRVYGTDDSFSENQLDTIADGGRYVLVNLGGTVVSRHQRTTATTSVEHRELSITKAIDWLAKGLRSTNRVFIGRSVITSGFLDQLTMSNEGFLDYAEQLGVVRKAALTNLLQDTDNRDTVLIEVEVAPAYPCNKIKITIVS